MATLSARAIRVRTAEGWQDIAIQGALGPQGPQGAQGIQGPQGVQGATGPAATPPPRVTSLPGAPVDGQEVYYEAEASSGITWHLRYRSASSSAYKWDFLGGPPLSVEGLATPSAFTSSTPTPFGAALVLPRAGDYLFQYGGLFSRSTPNEWLHMSFDVSDGVKACPTASWTRSTTASFEQGLPLASAGRVFAAAAGGSWRLRIWNSNNASGVNASNGWMTILPLRVS